MADFLHETLNLNAGDIVEVTLRHRANVLLLTEGSYHSYRSGGQFSYYGGQALRSPFRIVTPHTGTWHLVLDLGGAAGTIHYAVRIIST